MNFEEIFNSQEAGIVALILLVLSLVLIIYFTTKKENAEDVEGVPTLEQEILNVEQQGQPIEQVQPVENVELAPTQPVSQEQNDEIRPSDLLPQEAKVNEFEQQFPVGKGEATDKNFLIAGYNIGVNTVGSSLKNANLQLRSDPYIPRKSVGPWNESSIMSSDLTNRKTLEIGS